MDFGCSHGGSLLWLDNQLYFTIKQLEEEVVRNLLTLKKRFLLQFVVFQLQVFCFTVWIICCQMLKCSCKLVESLQQVNTFLSRDSLRSGSQTIVCTHTLHSHTAGSIDYTQSQRRQGFIQDRVQIVSVHEAFTWIPADLFWGGGLCGGSNKEVCLDTPLRIKLYKTAHSVHCSKFLHAEASHMKPPAAVVFALW